MRRRPTGSLKTCLFYLALLVLYALLGLPSTGLIGVLALVVVALFASELDRSGVLIAVPIVKLAGRLLVSCDRRDHIDEWVDQILSEGEAGLRPVFTAIGIAVRAAPRVALRQRHVRLRCQTRVLGYGLAFIVAYAEQLGFDEESKSEQRVSSASALLFIAGAPALGLQAILVGRSHKLRRELVAALGLAIWLIVGTAGPSFTPGAMLEQAVRGLVVLSLACVTLASISAMREHASPAWIARFFLWVGRMVGPAAES
jgi:hypothetical protein